MPKKPSKFRGKRLRIAIQLTAFGDFSDEEVAKRAGVTVRALLKARQSPYFKSCMRDIRAASLMTDLRRRYPDASLVDLMAYMRR